MSERGRSRTTTVLINIAACLEKTDEQVLPALYSRVGASFGATPTQLGNITLARAFMQALASPLAGVAAHFMPRGRVIAIGCLLWSTFTALFAFTNSIAAALPLCAINGIGLALVIPSVQSLTADLTPAESRGRAFGALWLTISFGGMLGAIYATNTGAHRPFGLDGWRVAFWSVSAISAVTGIFNARFVQDPTFQPRRPSTNRHVHANGGGNGSGSGVLSPFHRPSMGSPRVASSSSSTFGEAPTPLSAKLDPALVRSMVADILSVLKIPTFALIIAQGIVGSIPYASLVFLTLYLQLLGMSDAAAGALVALYLVGGGLGGLLGGYVGDIAAKSWPNHGRVVVTQFSVAVGIPFAVLIFKGLPMDGQLETVLLYGVVLLAFALMTAWPAPACNNPVFAEITPVRLRNLVYAFDRCFEGAMAAFATPFVGLLSERLFGFSGASAISGDPAIDRPNARALGSALLTFLVVPWTLCLVAYSSLHFTYPSDRRRALALHRSLKSAHDRDSLDGSFEESVGFIVASASEEGRFDGGGGAGGDGSLNNSGERHSPVYMARRQANLSPEDGRISRI